MREIKFRAWDERHQEMRYSNKHDGEFYINIKGVLYMYAIPKSEGYIGDAQYYKTYECMQYTGLKDKNGVEIYEGDILSYHETEAREVIFREDAGAFGIDTEEYENSKHLKFHPLYWLNTTQWKVIGNIYENQELIS